MLHAKPQTDGAHQDDPPEGLHELAESHGDSGWKRQGHAQTGEQVGEDRHHPLQQGADDQHRHTHDSDRVDQRRLHGRFEAHRFFDVGREALQNDVENTAGFAGFDHVGGEVIEDDRVLPHCVGQCRAAFHRGPHAGQRLLKRLVFLVGRQDFQTLHQGQAGIDHDRELAKEDRDVLGLDLCRTECGHREFFALFANGARRNAIAAQRLRQRLLIGGDTLSGNLLS